MKKIGIVVILVIIGGVLGALVAHYFSPGPAATVQSTGQTKFEYALQTLQNNYVDKVATDSLLDELVPKLIEQLDPHSDYIPKKDLQSVNESIEGKFDGIGVVFNMATDTAIVLSVVPGGPGAKEGVEPGDRIVMVDDTLVAGVKFDQGEMVSRLRGTRGTKVKLSIKRGNSSSLLDLTLTRAEIPILSIEAQYMTRDSAAYVRISNFAANTYLETVEAIDKLLTQGAKAVVMDLRDNGGGLLDQALMLANEFLAEGQIIVFVEGEHFERREWKASGLGAFQTIPLYVLINESSASASEIFAGAMQDNDRGTIVGRRSFGKGLVQEQISFADGSAARLTVARYYTPLGRPVQKPYVAGDNESYNAEIYQRMESKELETGVNTHVDSSKTYTTKAGKVLYGGGGITPDVYVAVDTTEVPEYFMKLFQKNAIFSFAQKYADDNRSQINGIKTMADMDRFYAERPRLFEEFVAYAARKHGVPQPTARARAEAQELIMAQLKGYIARNTPLEESGFFYYIQPIDDNMQRVAELLSVGSEGLVN